MKLLETAPLSSQLHRRVAEGILPQSFAETIEDTDMDAPKAELLQGVIEGLVDGILILSMRGEWIHANGFARRVCQQLAQDQVRSHPVPEEIWHVCRALIDSAQMFPNQALVMESEVKPDHSTTLRVRARWLSIDPADKPYLLVIIEDQRQSMENMAISEADRYRLTPREAEVWRLRRVGYTRKQIAMDLYITEETVKKHLRNIQMKREFASCLDAE
ncbi:MAG: helix-turn-helix transcriptional regulator [Scytolyngbya sp. HA4215-MV1]|jgi:DNA-binding CsgD family transcriptional regulator|nr:helix-turn-helix transcriptional regulator [Scytolyngbya sp. HA4215-MV1]